MEYKFSNRVKDLKPSAIREILKNTGQPGIISFSAGNPAPEAFPAQEIAEITEEIMRNHPVDALQYAITEGYAPLRKHMKGYMKEHYNIGRDLDDLIITSGAQQVMDLSAKALCNEGDVILCESPSFIGSLNAFRAAGIKLYGIPLEKDGMDIGALEFALRTEKNVKAIYVIPNFQNPAGITTSLEKRQEIYRLAKEHGVIIIEDNPYEETRFAGQRVPAIKSMDEDGIVVYAGSFSKVISPGMRVGYAIAPKEIIAKLTVCKQVSDVHSNILAQMIVYEYMTKYDFEEHLQNIKAIYGRRANLMMDMLDKNIGGKIRYNRVEGGLFIWCQLPEGVDMMEFCKAALQKKVAVVPGNAFLMDESEPCSCFRINFSTPTEEQLVMGTEILGSLL